MDTGSREENEDSKEQRKTYSERLKALRLQRKRYWQQYKKHRDQDRLTNVKGRVGETRGKEKIPNVLSQRAIGELLKMQACDLEIWNILIKMEKEKNDRL